MATPIEQIKDRLNILDVVGGYVKLTKSGKHWKGKSPFTSEKTPSFFVSPERGMYYCFSSGKGGDIFTFIQELEGVDFRGSLTLLAERAGVELTPERPEDRTLRETLYALLEEATQFFETKLQSVPEALAYLTSRGVTPQTRAKWRIGFAPNEWRALLEYLKTKGYSVDLMQKAGLVKGNERSAEPYDVFRHRIMFPICDASGRVVGFSGRDQSGDSAAPKYVNSPETPLYEKSRILFGYDKAKHGIRTLDFTLVVEGQFDLVLSHQAGYTNTVAISGTAMTVAHVEQIGRLSKKVVLALDADKAGIQSAKRSASIMLGKDMDVKVAHIEGGKDPADLVRDDPKRLKHAIGTAEHIIPFLITVIKAESHDERTMKLRVREEVVPFVTLIPNRIDAEHFEGVIARAVSTTPDAIHFEVERLREEAQRDAQKEEARAVGSGDTSKSAPHNPVSFARTEDIVFHLKGVLLWLWSTASPPIIPDILGLYLTEILGAERMQTLDDWSAEDKNKAAFLAEAAHGEQHEKVVKETIRHLLRELHVRLLKEALTTIRHTLTDAEHRGDRTVQSTLLARAAELQKRLGTTPSFEL
jgi:DNA primase